jgi:outer membrane murein-binding lipoprotein Lpp
MKNKTSRVSFASLLIATGLVAGCADNTGKTTNVASDATEFEAVKAQVAQQQAEFSKGMEKANKEKPAR